MSKSVKIKVILILILIVPFTQIFFCTSRALGKADPPSVVKEKLNGITDEEKKILQNLFILAQEIEVAEGEEKAIALDVENINGEIKDFEAKIQGSENAYTKKQEGLKQVLKSYQRMGPGSFFEIIMNSDSLSSFLQRLNILRDLTQNTGELLKQLDKSREELYSQKKILGEKLLLLKEKQNQSIEALNKKLQLKKEMEDYLASMEEERELYQGHLDNMQSMMKDLKLFLSKTSEEFSSIIENGSVPSSALRISFSLPDIKAFLDDKVLNDIIEKQPNLPKMVFDFNSGKVQMSFPEKDLILLGTFVIVDGHTLKFIAEEGSFYGMPLEPEYIKEIFSEGELELNFEPLLMGNTLQSLEVKDGYLEFSIKINLFSMLQRRI
jgi:peptidoglycan hydrolase CwlO-like protein